MSAVDAIVVTEPAARTIVVGGACMSAVDAIVVTKPAARTIAVGGAASPVSAVGVPGLQGPPGGGSFTALALTSLNAHTVVYAAPNGVANPDLTQPAQVAAICGLVLAAAVAGAPVTLLTGGTVVVNGWNWSPGPLYCGQGGVLTQTPPTSGALLQVATVTSPTTIQVDIEQPAIIL